MQYFNSHRAQTLRRSATALCLFAGLLTGLSAPALGAESEDDQVVISSEVNLIAEGDGNIVAIGGEVKVSGRANDEVVAIGGEVEVDVQAESETVVIGGEVEVRGAYAGELVAIGGRVDYYGANTEELVLMGGVITVHEEAISGGPSRVFGGEVELAGRFAGEGNFGGGMLVASGQFTDDINISAGDVTVSGEFYGDVIIEGKNIEFTEGTVITGHLLVRSPEEPTFHESLDFPAGAYTYEYIEEYDPKIGDLAISDILQVLIGVFYVLAIILCVTIIAAFIVTTAPTSLAARSSAAFRYAPGKSFLVGLATAMVTGIVGAFFAVILIGPLLPLFVGFVGYFIAGFTLVAMIARKVGEPISGGNRVVYTLAGAVILGVVNLVPILGSIVVFILSVIGMGAFVLALFKATPEAGEGALEDRRMQAFDDEDERGDFIHDANGNYDRNDASDEDRSKED